MPIWDPKANEIFSRALDCASPVERQAMLDEACENDPPLRERVEQLLAAHDSAGSFLQRPAATGLQAASTSPPGPACGVLGDFRIVREIGRGGMGTVYEAQQISLNRRVALKVLPFAAMLSEQQQLRFKNEARSAATLHHTNIVPVYSIGSERGAHFYAMQYIEGRTLAQLIDALRRANNTETCVAMPACSGAQSIAAKPLPNRSDAETVAVDDLSTAYSNRPRDYFRIIGRLGVQAAEALEHAHSAGVVHRDIKPANLLLDSRGNLWITDFGLAMLQGDVGLTLSGDLLGTIRYMSPEQALGKRATIDHRTDIYSLGATLYELLTLEPVFCSDDRQEALRHIATVEPRRPSELRASVPPELDTIILKALAKEPSERYATAQELADDLNRYLRDEPIRAQPPTLFQRSRKWTRRHRTVVVAAVLSGTVIMTASIILAVNMAFTREQSRAAASLLLEQQETKRALMQAESYRHEAERLSAIAALDRGLHACNQGEPARGLLWLAQSLKLVPEGDAELARVVRTNVAGWLNELEYRLQAILKHEGWVHCVAFSPDATILMSGGFDRTARLWNVASGTPFTPSLPHDALVQCAAFSPDGALLATGCEDGLIRLWSARDGRLLQDSWKHDDMVYAVAFSPDGKTLASGGRDGRLRVWGIDRSEPAMDPVAVGGFVMSVVFHPDGDAIITSGGDNRVQVWNARSGSLLRKSPARFGTLPIIALSPDGKTVAVGVTENVAYLMDLDSWKVKFRLDHRGSIHSLVFTRDGGTLLTSCADGKVRFWDTATGKPSALPVQHATAVYSAAVSPDGRTLATGTTSGLVRLWRHVPKNSEAELPMPNVTHIRSVAASSDGKIIAATLFGKIAILELSGRSLLSTVDVKPEYELHVVDFSPDGKRYLVAWDNRLQVFDTATQKPVSEFGKDGGKILAARFSPDGQQIATGSQARMAQLWDAANCKPIGKPIRHPHWVHSVAFSYDGQSLLTGCEDCCVRLWNLATHEQTGPPLRHQGPVRGVALSPDGVTALSGSWGDGIIRIWDLSSGQAKLTLPADRGHVQDVAFSPDGRTFATAHWDRVAQLWDAGTGKPLGPPVYFNNAVRALCFTPDGRTLVTGSLSGQVKATSAPQPSLGTAQEIAGKISLLTGLELTPDGALIPLAENNLEERHHFDDLGVPMAVE